MKVYGYVTEYCDIEDVQDIHTEFCDWKVDQGCNGHKMLLEHAQLLICGLFYYLTEFMEVH